MAPHGIPARPQAWATRPPQNGGGILAARMAQRPAARPPAVGVRPPVTAFSSLKAVKTEQEQPKPKPNAPKSTAALKVVALNEDLNRVLTLTGEYTDIGDHHGRRSYQRIPHDGRANVFLYFWDERDGEDQMGWWFGNAVGGEEVWARHAGREDGPPPSRGWKVPWDIEEQIELIGVELVTEAEAKEGSNFKAEVDQLVEEMKPLYETWDEALKVGEKLEELQEAVTKRQKSTMEFAQRLQKEISDGRRQKAPQADITALMNLQPAVRAIQARLATELRKVKSELIKPKASVTQVKVEKVDPPMPQTPRSRALPPKDLGKNVPEAFKPPEPAKPPESFKPPEPAKPPFKRPEPAKAPEIATPRVIAPAKVGSVPEPDHSAAEDVVKDFEDSVASILEMAEPLLQDCVEDTSAAEEVEISAKDLEKQVASVRTRLAELTQVTAKMPVPLRSKHFAATQKFQSRITEANKKLAPLLNFRTHFKERAEAKKATQSMETSLSEVELEVEKVSMMLSLSGSVQMCEEEVLMSDRLLREAQSSLQKWKAELTKRLSQAKGAAADEIRKLNKNSQEHQKKIDQLFQSIKSQRAGLQAQSILKEATEKVVKAEEALMKCSEVEMPFLKGIEILPKQESQPALKACDAAARVAHMAETTASGFIRSKMAEVKRSAIEESVATDMQQLLKRSEDVKKKIESFKQETEQRRASSNLVEVMTHMNKAVAAAAELSKWAGICQQGLDAPLETLTKALEEAPKAQKALAIAVADTSKHLLNEANEASASQKQELKNRLTAFSQESIKHRATVAQASKVLKSKEILEDQQRRTDQLEAQFQHLKEISMSHSEGEQEVIEEQKVMEALQKSLQAALNAAQLRAANAEPTLKTAMQKILERQRKVHTELNALTATSKERRERTLTEIWNRGALERLEQLQKWKTEAEELEMPFLRGLEILPYEEAIGAVAGMEDIAQKMQAGLQEARTFIAAKSLACKAMGATKQRDQLLQHNTGLPALSTWLVELRQTNLARRKKAQAQAAEAKISAFEKAVEGLIEDAAKDVDKPHEELLKSCEAQRAKVTSADALAKEAHEALKTSASKELNADWQSSVVRLKRAEVKLESSVTRKLKDLERQVTASKVLAQVKKHLEEMDDKVKKCQEKAQLALASTPAVICQEIMAEVLHDHMTTKAWSFEELFKNLAEGKTSASPEQLMKYVTALKPAAISEDKKDAWLMGRNFDLQLTSLKSLARRCGKCATAGRLEDEKGNVTELKPGDMLVVHGTKGSKDGKELLEVELLCGTSGVATSKTKEKLQLLPCATFEFHCEELERLVQEALTTTQNTVSKLTAEAKEVQTGPDEVRAELTKLTPKLQVPVAALSLLHKQIAVSKRNFEKGQAMERQKRFENLHQSEAEELYAEMEAKVVEAEALATEMQKKRQQAPDGLERCEGPISLRKEMKDLNDKILAAMEEAKAVALRMPEKLKSSPAAVKQRIVTLTKRSQKAKLTGAGEMKAMDKAMEALCASASSKLSMALRKVPSRVAFRNKKELEKLINTLAAPKEQQQLLLESFGDDDEERELKLLQLSQMYLVVQHPIAMTNSSNLDDAKTVRKLNATEILEVLEGPGTFGDLRRVFARALRDGMEGWVTMEGNQGTSYVKETSKPFYVCTKDEVLMGEDGDKVKLGEVVELLQGPERKISNIQRAKCKVLKDQTSGWFTIVDQFGTTYAKEVPNLYKCVSPVVMTEELDIESKVMSRLSKGSCLVLEDGPTKDSRGNLERLRGRLVGTSSSGWVTIKGNAGTVFLEACQNHYVILQPTSLEKHGQLQVDEIVQVLERKEETAPQEQRLKVRHLADGRSGWISLKANSMMKLWSKQYTARMPQSLKGKGEEVLREVGKGEQLEALTLPKSHGSGSDSSLRVKVQLKKDGLVGWVLVRDDKNRAMLEF